LFTPDFDMVLLGTGDREHPTYSNAAVGIVNRFYMLEDYNNGDNACPSSSCPTPIQDNTDNTSTDVPSGLFDATTSQFDLTDSSYKGFYINLTHSGEKVVNAPTTVGGLTVFGTNTPIAPDPDICNANLGLARGYAVDPFTARGYFSQFNGGGLPPSPVSGQVQIGANRYFFLIGGPNSQEPEGTSGGGAPTPLKVTCTTEKAAIGACKVNIEPPPIRTRTYWYREHDE